MSLTIVSRSSAFDTDDKENKSIKKQQQQQTRTIRITPAWLGGMLRWSVMLLRTQIIRTANRSWSIMPQSHPNTGPVRFLSPVRFLARKAEWSARRNFTSVLFSWSHQATGPVRLDTAVYLWFGWIIRMTPRVPRVVPVRASYGPRTGIFNVFHILRAPYGARAGPARVPYGALTDTQGNWHDQNLQKSRTGVVFCRTGPVRTPYGPHTGCSRAV